MKKISFILIAALFIITSCEKENNSNQLSKQNSNNLYKSVYLNDTIFNDTLYGVIHNECLDYITKHSQFPYITRDERLLKQYVYEYLIKKYGEYDTNKLPFKPIMYDNYSDLATNLYNNSKISNNVLNYFKILDNISISSKDISDFDYKIASLVANVNENIELLETEKHLINSSCLFFRSSTVYWYNASKNINSAWYVYKDYFPIFKSIINSKKPSMSIMGISLADGLTFLGRFADCSSDCPVDKASPCSRLCAQDAAYNALYASVCAM